MEDQRALRGALTGDWRRRGSREGSNLETTLGKIDGFFSQIPFKCHQNQMTSVGD